MLLDLIPAAHAQTVQEAPTVIADAQPLIATVLSYLAPIAIALLLWLVRQAVAAWDRFVSRHMVLAALSIDAAHRDAIMAAASRQASALVADGAVTVSGLEVTVRQPALAAAVRAAELAVPDALDHFGITPEGVAQRIIARLPHVPAVAQLQAQCSAAPAAPITSPTASGAIAPPRPFTT